LSRKLTIDHIRKLTEAKGFTLLTSEYKDNHQKLDVICSKGHLCHPTSKSIMRGGGCSICYNDTEVRMAAKAQPHKLQEVKAMAIERGGLCLSDHYINNRESLRFKCSEGHEWETCFKVINHGSWCPVCALGGTISDKIVASQEAAFKRGGKLLSEEFSLSEKMKWECSSGHQWDATYQNVVFRFSWCPYCKSSFSENICRQYLELLFDRSFPRERPSWLRNTNGRTLELDGYCQELGIAFEHQGLQHYENISHFKDNTESIQVRDNLKKNLCNKAGVILIEIPALFYMTQLDNLHTVISSQLDTAGVYYSHDKARPVSEIIDLDTVNFIDREQEIQKIKNIAASKDGYCHSTKYTWHNCKIDLSCCFGHKWATTATAIKSGHWCPICAHKTTITIEDMQQIANDRGGLCLSDEYQNNHIKLKWQCSCGNIWNATYNAIQRGDWCPKCGIIKRSKAKHIGIEAYQIAAENKGGRCLSTSIASCFDKIELECAEGHRWFGRADQIKNTKQWCPECAMKKRISCLRKAA